MKEPPVINKNVDKLCMFGRSLHNCDSLDETNSFLKQASIKLLPSNSKAAGKVSDTIVMICWLLVISCVSFVFIFIIRAVRADIRVVGPTTTSPYSPRASSDMTDEDVDDLKKPPVPPKDTHIRYLTPTPIMRHSTDNLLRRSMESMQSVSTNSLNYSERESFAMVDLTAAVGLQESVVDYEAPPRIPTVFVTPGSPLLDEAQGKSLDQQLAAWKKSQDLARAKQEAELKAVMAGQTEVRMER